MMQADAHNKIRSVTIHYYYCLHYICGFCFFDKDGALLWKIGYTGSKLEETVMLEENEVIVGVVAKLYPDWQSLYTDF
jgi:hypothetical protein